MVKDRRRKRERRVERTRCGRRRVDAADAERRRLMERIGKMRRR